MKKILGILSASLLAGSSLFAQVDLEHTYEGKSFVARQLFDNGLGAKYTYINRTEATYEIYNEDHSLWKTIDLSVLGIDETKSIQGLGLGAHIFDGDDDIETLLNITDNDTGVSVISILDENGVVQASIDAGGEAHFSGFSSEGIIIEFGPNLWEWSNNTKIYNIVTLEEVANIGHGGVVYNFTPENEEFLVAIDNINDDYLVYDISGNLQFTIPLPSAPDGVDYAPAFNILSKNIHDTDDEYELVIGYSENGFPVTHSGFLLSQNGDVVQTVEASGFTLEKDGWDPARIVGNAWGGFNNKTYVYNLEMTEIEQEFSGTQFLRSQLDGYGEVITVVFSGFSPIVEVYHQDGSLWQEKDLDVPEGTIRGIVTVSSNFYNNDSGLEYTYSFTNITDPSESGVKVETEDGTSLLSVTGGSSFVAFPIPGTANKLLVMGSAPGEDFTEVYSTSTTAPLSINEWLSVEELRLYPNPVSDVLNLSLGDQENIQGQFFVYDLMGREVLQESFQQAEVQFSVAGLKKGMYSIRIQSGNTMRNMKFIKL